MPPYVAVAFQADNAEYPTVTADQVNSRNPLLVAPQEAPDGFRYGATPARWARMPMYHSLVAKQWRAVMADAQSGVMGKDEFAQFVSQPRGKSLTFGERGNIVNNTPSSYGSRFELTPWEPGDEQRRAEMGL